MKIVLAFNGKPEEVIVEDAEPPDRYAEFDPPHTIASIIDALVSSGHQVYPVNVGEDFIEKIKSISPHIVFNIAEGTKGEARESQVPSILEWLGIPYIGSGPLTMAVTLDKPITKQIFKSEGIPTPHFRIYSDTTEISKIDLSFPLIVKPSHEGSSMGLNRKSIVYTIDELKDRINTITGLYKQEALVEEFIEGREITVGILGNNPPEVLPPKELDFSEVPEELGRFASGEIKAKYWHLVKQSCPAHLEEDMANKIREIALKVFKVLKCRDLARLDIRLSKDGIPYVLEVNPLPDLDPKEGNFPHMAKVRGLSYMELINTILKAGVNRYPALLKMEDG